MAAAEDLASAVVLESVPESVPVLGRHRSSTDKIAACRRGFSRIPHWQPNLRTSDYHRSTLLVSAEDLASVPESVLG